MSGKGSLRLPHSYEARDEAGCGLGKPGCKTDAGCPQSSLAYFQMCSSNLMYQGSTLLRSSLCTLDEKYPNGGGTTCEKKEDYLIRVHVIERDVGCTKPMTRKTTGLGL